MTKYDPASKYWEGCANGDILFMACMDCGGTLSYPRDFCPSCGSRSVTWKRSSGTGIVEARTLVARPPSEAFASITPYALILVRIDDDFTIMAHGELDLDIGAEVQAEFRNVAGKHLPYFKRRPPLQAVKR
jgi:uncharacterized OB-fold protein